MVSLPKSHKARVAGGCGCENASVKVSLKNFQKNLKFVSARNESASPE